MKKMTKILAVLAAITTVTVSAMPAYAADKSDTAAVSEKGLITDLETIKELYEDNFNRKGYYAVGIRYAYEDNVPFAVHLSFENNKTMAECMKFAEDNHIDPNCLSTEDRTVWGSSELAKYLNNQFEELKLEAYAYCAKMNVPDAPEGHNEKGICRVLYYDDSTLPTLKKVIQLHSFDYINDPDMIEFVKANDKANGKNPNIFGIKKALDEYIKKNELTDKTEIEMTDIPAEDNCWTGADIKVHMNIYDYSNAADTLHPDKYKSFSQDTEEDVRKYIKESGFDENTITLETVQAGKSSQKCDIFKGDANNDGDANVRDCSFIAAKLAGGKSSALPDTADYNSDGRRDIRDAAALCKDLSLLPSAKLSAYTKKLIPLKDLFEMSDEEFFRLKGKYGSGEDYYDSIKRDAEMIHRLFAIKDYGGISGTLINSDVSKPRSGYIKNVTEMQLRKLFGNTVNYRIDAPKDEDKNSKPGYLRNRFYMSFPDYDISAALYTITDKQIMEFAKCWFCASQVFDLDYRGTGIIG